MLSLQTIRQEPDRVREALASRHKSAPLDEILALDAERRNLLRESEALKARRNEVSKEIGRMKEKPPALLAKMRAVGDRIKELDGRLATIEPELNSLLLRVPNLPDPSVPPGAGEEDNVEVRRWGEPPALDFTPRPHWELGERLDILDFERGVKLGGPRFYVMKGLGARLERALTNWMLDLHLGQGYVEVAPPYLARREVMTGTGQLPKFEDDMYRIESDDLFLIPTAEVPVTNLHREEILPAEALPRKYVAYTPCFRREAGSAGRDTRGVTRVHQFDKVEMVKFTTPETSAAEHDSLIADAESVLQGLGLAYRVLLICAGDLGFAGSKQVDLEVWMPGQGRFVEISSCSNFDAFQARRANIRYRPTPTAHPELVHTLNGSGLAVGRTLAAVLENYQRADGSVVVPEVLRPYMGAVEMIR
jgi:seryl-tRNA synthetase